MERAVSLLSALSTPRGSRSTAAVETNTGPGTAAAAVAYACSSPISARGRREPQKGCWRRAEGVAGAAVNWLLAHRLVLNLSDHIWHFHRPPARFRRRDTTNSPHRCIVPTSKKPGRRRRAHGRRTNGPKAVCEDLIHFQKLRKHDRAQAPQGVDDVSQTTAVPVVAVANARCRPRDGPPLTPVALSTAPCAPLSQTHSTELRS